MSILSLHLTWSAAINIIDDLIFIFNLAKEHSLWFYSYFINHSSQWLFLVPSYPLILNIWVPWGFKFWISYLLWLHLIHSSIMISRLRLLKIIYAQTPKIRYCTSPAVLLPYILDKYIYAFNISMCISNSHLKHNIQNSNLLFFTQIILPIFLLHC